MDLRIKRGNWWVILMHGMIYQIDSRTTRGNLLCATVDVNACQLSQVPELTEFITWKWYQSSNTTHPPLSESEAVDLWFDCSFCYKSKLTWRLKTGRSQSATSSGRCPALPGKGRRMPACIERVESSARTMHPTEKCWRRMTSQRQPQRWQW